MNRGRKLVEMCKERPKNSDDNNSSLLQHGQVIDEKIAPNETSIHLVSYSVSNPDQNQFGINANHDVILELPEGILFENVISSIIDITQDDSHQPNGAVLDFVHINETDSGMSAQEGLQEIVKIFDISEITGNSIIPASPLENDQVPPVSVIENYNHEVIVNPLPHSSNCLVAENSESRPTSSMNITKTSTLQNPSNEPLEIDDFPLNYGDPGYIPPSSDKAIIPPSPLENDQVQPVSVIENDSHDVIENQLPHSSNCPVAKNSESQPSTSMNITKTSTLQHPSNEPLEIDDFPQNDGDPDWIPSSSDSSDDEDAGKTSPEKQVSAIPVAVERQPITRKRTRKPIADPSLWKININKRLRKECLPYKTKNGIAREAKHPKPVSCEKCYFKCTTIFSEQDRVQSCQQFHAMSYERQKDYLLSRVENQKIVRKSALPDSKKGKNVGRRYSFLKNGTKFRVCKQFFLKTLCISQGPLEKAFQKINLTGTYEGLDQRGRKSPPNKTKPEVMRFVKEHIESFPTMESHYCRKNSKQAYLDAKLSIKKMYELYEKRCKKEGKESVSEITYRRAFCEDYNLSFFKPKKDQCLICTNFEKASGDKKCELEPEYISHLKGKEAANEAKNEDKKRSEVDTSFLTVTFDLQKVLQIPFSDVSQMYYSRKLNAYNLTVYEGVEPNRGFCFCWTEVNGARGSCEIGSALVKWLENLPENVTEVSLFSDTCGGQNRNQQITSLFIFLVNTLPNIHTIQHKFLESGHSHMEVDSMHSAIESAKDNVPVFTLQDWVTIMRVARSNRKKKSAQHYSGGPRNEIQ